MGMNILVLGAGASAHYDFPLAYEIVQRVRRGTDSMKARAADFRIHPRSYDEFVDRLLKSGCTSIDQFADYLDKPDDIFLAKALIAYHLGIFENRASLSQKMGGGHWYELLANHLIGATLDTFPQRDIGIITFNYERSLEQYLIDCLTSRFEGRNSPEQIRAAFLRLPIIHIYGRTGYLPGFASGFGPGFSRGFGPGALTERPYEPVMDHTQLQAAIAEIHILRELRDDPKRGEREAARKLLRDSNGVVSFLGFAYAQENLEALDLSNTCKARTVHGTIFEIGQDERHTQLKARLKTFGVELVDDWRFDVFEAVKTRPATIFGEPR